MIARRSLAHAMIDALEAYGDLDAYYRLQHATAAEIAELEKLLTTWLESVKIKVED